MKWCLGLDPRSLKSVAKAVCGITLAKSSKVVMSNWENNVLTPKQVQYGAYDAVIANLIYDGIVSRTQRPVIPPANSYSFGKYYSTFIDSATLKAFKESETAAMYRAITAIAGDNTEARTNRTIDSTAIADAAVDVDTDIAVTAASVSTSTGSSSSASKPQAVILQPALCSRSHFRTTTMDIFYHSDDAVVQFMRFIADSDEKWLALNEAWIAARDGRAVTWSAVCTQ